MKVGDKVRPRKGHTLVGALEIGEVVYVDGRHLRVCWEVSGHYWEDETTCQPLEVIS